MEDCNTTPDECSQESGQDSDHSTAAQDRITAGAVQENNVGGEKPEICTSSFGVQLQEVKADISSENNHESGDIAKTENALKEVVPDPKDDSQSKKEEAFKVPIAFALPSRTIKDQKKSESNSPSTDNKKASPTDSLPQKPPSKKAFSPAEIIQQSNVALAYLEPPWSGLCETKYFLEILKNGQIIGQISLTDRPFYVFGRLASCHVHMEHPSLSRHHAVLQYCGKPDKVHPSGWYIYDLESTHGTVVNKNKLRPRSFTRVRVGHVMKFGGSTRLYVLQGPEEDQDEERPMKSKETNEEASGKSVEGQPSGCMWGMSEDAAEEAQPVFDVAKNEDLYKNDPKKCLKNVFEREGFDLPEYECEEDGFARFKCSVELPMLIDDLGSPTVASVSISGKKKEAVLACALEACRLLDMHGELRKSHAQGRERKARDWESNDFYSSDEDEFLDRTGDIEKKRSFRRKLAGVEKKETKTYPELAEELRQVQEELQEIGKKLQAAKDAAQEFADKESGLDALDAYMARIKSGTLLLDTRGRMALKKRQLELRQQEGKLSRLVKLTQPAQLPSTGRGRGGAKPAHVGSKKWTAVKVNKPLTVQQPALKPSLGPEIEEEEEDEEGADTVNSGEEKVEKTSESTVETKEEESNSDKTVTIPRKAVVGCEFKKPVDQVAKETTQADEEVAIETRRHDEVAMDTTQPNDELDMETKDNSPCEESKTKNESEKSTEKEEDTQKSSVYTESSTQQETEFVSEKQASSKVKKRGRHRAPAATADFLQQAGGKKAKTLQDVDPTYETWLPPTDQAGDGKTHLNKKLGY